MACPVESLARRTSTQTLRWLKLFHAEVPDSWDIEDDWLNTSQAAWHAMRTKLGISPENIILYGQSIGTVPTVDLASRFEVDHFKKSEFNVCILMSDRLGRWSFTVRWCPGCASPSLKLKGPGSSMHSPGSERSEFNWKCFEVDFILFQHWQDASCLISCLSNTWHRRRGSSLHTYL